MPCGHKFETSVSPHLDDFAADIVFEPPEGLLLFTGRPTAHDTTY